MQQNQDERKKAIQSSFAEKYAALRQYSADLLKELLQLVLNSNPQNHKEQCEITKNKFKELLLRLIVLEESTSIVLRVLDPFVARKYKADILINNCFYIYAEKLINKLQGNDQELYDWGSINQKLCNHYDKLVQYFHEQTIYEFHLAQALVLMLEDLNISQTYLPDKAETEKNIRTYNLMVFFTSNLKSISLKVQCETYLFFIENDELGGNPYQGLYEKRQETDFYFNQISPHVINQPNIGDNLLYFHFAHTTKLHRLLTQLFIKIDFEETHAKGDKKPITSCPINIKNYNAIIKELTRFHNEFKIQETLDIIKIILSKNKSFSHSLMRLIQTNDLIKMLLQVLCLCVKMSLEIINYNIRKTKDDPSFWQIYFDSLELKKNYLELLQDINAKQAVVKNDPELIDHSLALTCKEAVRIIESMTTQKNRINRQSDKFLGPNKAPSHTRSKKTRKEQETRKAFSQIRKNQNVSSTKDETIEEIESNRCLEVNTKAENYIQNDQWVLAENLYLALISQTDPLTPIELVTSHISLADIYQRQQKNELAIQHYQIAVKKAQEFLATELNAKIKRELEIQQDIAKDLAAELESNDHLLKTLLGYENSSPASEPCKTPSFLNKLPTPQILQQEIPLPDFFNKIISIIGAKKYCLRIVGGYVRDFLLKESAIDIDAIVFDPNTKCDKLTLLHNILKDLQQHFPQCEIRSQNYPIIHIEHQNTVIEISTIEVSPAIFQHVTLVHERLLHIMLEDARQRDATENALYYDPEHKEITDFFGGLEDIKTNTYKLIRTPRQSFMEEPYLIFRVIRSIVNRLNGKNELKYDPDIITAIHENSAAISKLKKDRCSTAIFKTLFRGNALPSWQFLLKHDLQRFFFLLPRDEHKKFRHSLIISQCLGDLDKRIKTGKMHNVSFIFAVLFWGAFREQLEIVNEQDKTLTQTKIVNLAQQFFDSQDMPLYLTDNLIRDIKGVWFAYLHINRIVEFVNPQFRYGDIKRSHALSRLINHSLEIVFPKDVVAVNNKNSFFKNMSIERLLVESIRENKIIYSYKNKYTTLEIGNSNLISATNRTIILRQLKRNLQRILGKDQVYYEQSDDSISIGTNYIHKKREIDSLMSALFNGEPTKIIVPIVFGS